MGARRGTKNNVLAGTFVLLSVAAGMLGVISLAKFKGWLTGTVPYVVEFDLTTGASGLDSGSMVKIGGRRAGRVDKVTFRKDDSGKITGVLVTIGINSELDVTLHSDDIAFLEIPLLGTTSTINIPSVGSGAPLPPGNKIRGDMAPPQFLAQAGFGEEERTRVKNIIDMAEQFTKGVTGKWSDSIEPAIDPMVADARAATTEFRGVAEDARAVSSSIRDESWPAWKDKIDTTMARVDTTSQNIEQGSAELREGIADGRALLSDAREVVAENRPDVRATVENVRSLTDDARKDYQMVRSILENAETTMGEVDQILSTASAEFDAAKPQLRRTIANARLASDQLKLALVEIRTAPWKLLYQPGRKELESELVFSSVRQYAQAVSDLRATADAINTVSSGPISSSQRTQLDELLGTLDIQFQTYRDREKEFLERWLRSDR